MFQLVGIILNSEDTVLVKRNLMEQFCMAISLVLWFQPQKKTSAELFGGSPTVLASARNFGVVSYTLPRWDFFTTSHLWLTPIFVQMGGKTIENPWPHDASPNGFADFFLAKLEENTRVVSWRCDSQPGQAQARNVKGSGYWGFGDDSFRFVGWFSRSLPSPIFGFCFSFCKFDRNLSLRKIMAVASLLHASSEFCRTVAGLNFKTCSRVAWGPRYQLPVWKAWILFSAWTMRNGFGTEQNDDLMIWTVK